MKNNGKMNPYAFFFILRKRKKFFFVNFLDKIYFAQNKLSNYFYECLKERMRIEKEMKNKINVRNKKKIEIDKKKKSCWSLST